MAAKSRVALIVLICLIVGLGTGLFLVWPYLEGEPPEIAVGKKLTHLGKENQIAFKISDRGRGLAQVTVTLRQNQQEKIRFERQLPPQTAQTTVDLKVEPLKLGLAQGPATLRVEARDRSWRGWFKGNLAVQDFEVVVDTVPPRLSVLSQIIHVNLGGTGLVLYKMDKDAVEHGVVVGEKRFKGYSPWPQNPETGLCYFAYSQDEEKTLPVMAWATDAAGNQSRAGVNVRLRWKKFRQDDVNLSDNVLSAISARFAAEAPAGQNGPLEVFLWINKDLRAKNHARVVSLLDHPSGEQLWQGVFKRPRGKPMAGFGDRRRYFYKGKEVSQAVHLGVDLADVAASPIRAVAKGKVILAGPLGIYGDCVILDHGQGVATLYGHLSKIEVSPAQEVQEDQQLGLSGATGLALGDHLHFSVLVGGVFVNPTEWWDPHWIQDNIALRFKEAGLSLPAGK